MKRKSPPQGYEGPPQGDEGPPQRKRPPQRNSNRQSQEPASPQDKLSSEQLRRIIPNAANASAKRELVARLRKVIGQDKSKRRRARHAAEARGENVVRGVTNTTESMRRADDTIVDPADVEVEQADEVDEFSGYFSGLVTPKILVTTCKSPGRSLKKFVTELLLTIPNCFYYKREGYRIKSIVKYAANKEFTDVVVLTQHNKRPCGMYISHLPEGPTSFFRLTNVKLAQEMNDGAKLTSHDPEILLNNFGSRLGRRVARQLAALFPQKPEFQGRRTITFHNQRDFIFFRQHRYIFSDEGRKCRLQEIGPRMTMKLRYIQRGTFDTSGGMFEYVWRPDSQVDRKVMFM